MKAFNNSGISLGNIILFTHICVKGKILLNATSSEIWVSKLKPCRDCQP